MNTDDYNNKLDKIVNDKTKFEKIIVQQDKMHPLLAKEKSVVYYINKYITDENGFSDQTHIRA